MFRASTAPKKKPFETPDQAGLRRSGISIIPGKVDSMEPLLMMSSDMEQDGSDWHWAIMSRDRFKSVAKISRSVGVALYNASNNDWTSSSYQQPI